MIPKHLLIGMLTITCISSFSCGSKAIVSVVEQPDTNSINDFYVSNREPLLPSPFIKLSIGSIEPRGWVRKQVKLQANGFHGHLTEISGFLKKENNAWLNPEGVGEHGWEEVPYWLKGFSNAAYVLSDEKMIAEAKIWIEGALNSRKPDGWFGPDRARSGAATALKGRADLWPNMIMLFCLQDYYDYTGDERVIKLMKNYFEYLMTVPDDKFLVGYWPRMRGGDLLYSIYWLYNRAGDAWLLDLAEKVHRRTAEWSKDVIDWHNVNLAQGFKEPAIYYMQSGDMADLSAAERNWQKVRDIYGQVPGGMFGGDENCRPGFTGPRQAIETCGIVEEMLSDEMMLTITGNAVWADRYENVAFNSFPAALTADFKALRYLTAPNMVLSDSKSKSPGLQNSGPMLLMNPYYHRCCQHNVGHGWPYYAENLWLATPDNGLAAVFYADSQVKAKVGDGTRVIITEKTHYPFDEKIEFLVSLPKPVRFPLYLRVPGWCDKPLVKVNTKLIDVKARPHSYIAVERKWANGDKVSLELPMKITLTTWTKNNNSVSVNRGPLTYSLKIGEKYVRQGGTDKWPAWEIHPMTPWNYGLVLDEENPARSFKVVRKQWPSSNQPFEVNAVPIELIAKAKKIPEWQMDYLGLVGKLQPSPAKSDEPVETVRLIPMGAARLRISSFPIIGSGPDAYRWKSPPTASTAFPAKASHCFWADTVEALSDGLLPRNSNDHGIPRFTWWDHRGSKEWVQYDFKKPRKISAVKVYWFDDAPQGDCRVPESWQLFYKDGEEWRLVPVTGSYGVEKDKFNRVSFGPVMTSSLKLEVQLQPDFSGGILEWQVDTGEK